MTSFEKIKSKIKENKILQYLIICAVSILIILFLALIFNGKSDDIDKTSIEKSLENALEKIEGVDDVSVLIAYSDSEKVIAYTTVTENLNGVITSTKTPYILNGEVVVIKESAKEICGVIVVVEGDDDILTKIKIQNVTTTFLDVDASLVEIIGAK